MCKVPSFNFFSIVTKGVFGNVGPLFNSSLPVKSHDRSTATGMAEHSRYNPPFKSQEKDSEDQYGDLHRPSPFDGTPLAPPNYGQHGQQSFQPPPLPPLPLSLKQFPIQATAIDNTGFAPRPAFPAGIASHDDRQPHKSNSTSDRYAFMSQIPQPPPLQAPPARSLSGMSAGSNGERIISPRLPGFGLPTLKVPAEAGIDPEVRTTAISLPEPGIAGLPYAPLRRQLSADPKPPITMPPPIAHVEEDPAAPELTETIAPYHRDEGQGTQGNKLPPPPGAVGSPIKAKFARGIKGGMRAGLGAIAKNPIVDTDQTNTKCVPPQAPAAPEPAAAFGGDFGAPAHLPPVATAPQQHYNSQVLGPLDVSGGEAPLQKSTSLHSDGPGSGRTPPAFMPMMPTTFISPNPSGPALYHPNNTVNKSGTITSHQANQKKGTREPQRPKKGLLARLLPWLMLATIVTALAGAAGIVITLTAAANVLNVLGSAARTVHFSLLPAEIGAIAHAITNPQLPQPYPFAKDTSLLAGVHPLAVQTGKALEESSGRAWHRAESILPCSPGVAPDKEETLSMYQVAKTKKGGLCHWLQWGAHKGFFLLIVSKDSMMYSVHLAPVVWNDYGKGTVSFAGRQLVLLQKQILGLRRSKGRKELAEHISTTIKNLRTLLKEMIAWAQCLSQHIRSSGLHSWKSFAQPAAGCWQQHLGHYYLDPGSEGSGMVPAAETEPHGVDEEDDVRNVEEYYDVYDHMVGDMGIHHEEEVTRDDNEEGMPLVSDLEPEELAIEPLEGGSEPLDAGHEEIPEAVIEQEEEEEEPTILVEMPTVMEERFVAPELEQSPIESPSEQAAVDLEYVPEPLESNHNGGEKPEGVLIDDVRKTLDLESSLSPHPKQNLPKAREEDAVDAEEDEGSSIEIVSDEGELLIMDGSTAKDTLWAALRDARDEVGAAIRLLSNKGKTVLGSGKAAVVIIIQGIVGFLFENRVAIVSAISAAVVTAWVPALKSMWGRRGQLTRAAFNTPEHQPRSSAVKRKPVVKTLSLEDDEPGAVAKPTTGRGRRGGPSTVKKTTGRGRTKTVVDDEVFETPRSVSRKRSAKKSV